MSNSANLELFVSIITILLLDRLIVKQLNLFGKLVFLLEMY